MAVSVSQKSRIFWICSSGRNFGNLERDHVAMVGTHAARSTARSPRWNRQRRKDRSAVTTSGARLEVTKVACRCTKIVMFPAEIFRQLTAPLGKDSDKNDRTIGV